MAETKEELMEKAIHEAIFTDCWRMLKDRYGNIVHGLATVGGSEKLPIVLEIQGGVGKFKPFRWQIVIGTAWVRPVEITPEYVANRIRKQFEKKLKLQPHPLALIDEYVAYMTPHNYLSDTFWNIEKSGLPPLGYRMTLKTVTGEEVHNAVRTTLEQNPHNPSHGCDGFFAPSYAGNTIIHYPDDQITDWKIVPYRREDFLHLFKTGPEMTAESNEDSTE